LAALLHERQVQQALDTPAVQVVVKQTVYHLGQLVQAQATRSSLRLLWRSDWGDSGGILEVLSMELATLAEELDPKPRDHEAVLLLGELAAYLSDWHPPCREVARHFAAMTSRAADELQQQISSKEQKGNDVIASQLIAKQSKARMLALLCHSSGQLTVADVGCMALLMAQIKHGDIYLEGNAAAAAELALLRVRCHNVMCKRLPDLMPLLQQHPELLTDAISGILGLVPDDLQWQQVSSVVTNGLPATASYQAISRDGHVYSLNLLDGTVLLDGSPPGRLPR
jgi:hypothetical protein